MSTFQPASIEKPRLTVSEHLLLILKGISILPFRLVIHILRKGFWAFRNGYNVKFYALCAAINVVFMTLSHREIQARTPTTTQSYLAWIKKKPKRNQTSQVQALSKTGGNLLWIGNRDRPAKIVLFLHGGGYVAPALKGHFEWCWNAYIQAGKEQGVDVAVACLHYTLLVEGRFPVPLRQASAALNQILATGIHPSNIFIGGDSAGGNLTMQLLMHILHPHEEVPPIKLSGPLGGIFLVSPWLSNNLQHASFRENDDKDMISQGALDTLGEALYGAERVAEHRAEIEAGDFSAANPWETPLDSMDETWLDGLASVAPKIYVTVGQNEILRDQSVALVTVLKKRGIKSDVKFEIAEKEAHDFILLEGESGQIGDATIRMKNWFQSVIV